MPVGSQHSVLPAPPAGGEGVTAADACPGILDLHQARDGLVARIRLPGGYASAARLRALATLAERFGDGSVDLTARGNVQLRGIRADTADRLAERATAAGLLPSPSHDRARNISASPLAGLTGHRDLRGLVRALDRAILADPRLAALPGRFLFALDDSTGRAGLGRCDVGLRLESGGTELIVAGRLTGRRGPAAQMTALALVAARAFLSQRQSAEVSPRVGRLPDGGAAVAAAVGGVLGRPVQDTETRLALGPLSDTVQADTVPADTVPADTVPTDTVPADAATAVVVAAPLGRLTARQLRHVADIVRPGDVARFTTAGRIVLPLPAGASGAVAGAADEALGRLAAAGLLTRDEQPLAAVTACAGMTCSRSLADVRALAAPVPGLDAVHWAGCDRRCGLPADATAVVATPAGQFAIGDGAAGRPLSLTALGRTA
ncbi:MAG TPA: precorrin-3B synthase [Streptosporangiaceae bacterium]|nr:precorrin-3B synthase [Streptosporangiaceae bacterium]